MEAVEFAEKNIASTALFAFNSNIDYICRVDSRFGDADFPEELEPLLVSIMRGEAGEFKISKRTAEWIGETFRWRERRMGGQAGIMANAAAALGVRAFAYAAALSNEQEELFSRDVAVLGKRTTESSRHFVFEFKKGTKVMGARIPSSNRVIATYDPANFNLRISKEFVRESLRIAPSLECAVISGFHNLDLRVAGSRIATVRQLLHAWRKENPSIRIHLELGCFSNKTVLRKTLGALLPEANSIGMNEREAADVIAVMGMDEGRLGELADEIIVHEAHGSTIYGNNRRASAVKAALFGHALAAYKAVMGRDASFAALKRFLRKRRPLFRFKGVPAIKVEPRFTVGLGDTFAAGFALVK